MTLAISILSLCGVLTGTQTVLFFNQWRNAMKRNKLEILQEKAAKVGATVDCEVENGRWECFVSLPPGYEIDGDNACFESCNVNDARAIDSALNDLLYWIQKTPVVTA